MQTVQFQCGKCNKLMAVGIDHVGRQVRCPHCQAVVVAPAAAPAPSAAPPVPGSPLELSGASEPAYSRPFPPLEQNQDSDSIFAPPEEPDDLFGGPRQVPLLELPPARQAAAPGPPPASAPSPEPFPGAQVATSTDSSPPGDGSIEQHSAVAENPFVAMATPPPVAAPPTPAVPAAADGTAGWMNPAQAESQGGVADLQEGGPTADPLASVSRKMAKRSDARGGSWFILLVFVPLLSYALLATIAVIILWNRLQLRPPDPREFLPDVDGDNPGALKPKAMRFQYDNRLADSALPDHLRTRLGQKIVLGDLEVTPTSVERKKVAVFIEGGSRPEPLENPSLVLHLKLRNLAKDYAFVPLDNYFDRYDTGGLQRPLTQLEAGPLRIYGGPAKWYPRKRSKRDNTYREWVEGRKDFDEFGLQPGEEIDSFVCTDGTERIAGHLATYHGPLLWRVHLRRGLVEYQGARKPVTAVIGVEFSGRDVKDVDQPGAGKNG